MPEQLPLPLPVRTAQGRDDFFVSSSNAQAVAQLETPEAWGLSRLCLVGARGAGKSHLAGIWASERAALSLSAATLTEALVEDQGTQAAAIALEDADGLPPGAETALFHLINLCQERRCPLLMTAKTAPARWPVALPDLASRLGATPVATLAAPDDALLQAVAVKLFADRQLRVGPDVVRYLVTRSERSLAALRAHVARIDAAALSRKRAITRPLVAEVLDNPAPSLPD